MALDALRCNRLAPLGFKVKLSDFLRCDVATPIARCWCWQMC